MVTSQRFPIHRLLLNCARLGLGVTLAFGAATGCKKSVDTAQNGGKPPIVKAKKSGADAKTGDDKGAKPGDAAAKPGATPGKPADVADKVPAAPIRPTMPPAAPTPETQLPAPVPAPPAAGPPAAVAAPAPVVPVPVGRGKPAEVVAKAEPVKPEPVRPEAARPEPIKAEAKPEPPPLPPGAVVVHATPGEPPLDVNGYIIAADLPKVLGTKQKFHRTELVGINPTPNYNAMFYATDKPDVFGVSVQVWRDANLAESRTRFNTMKNSYSNVSPTNKITDMGFRSFYGNVVTLVFVDPHRPLLAAISCSTKVCSGDQMIELARRVAERLH
jgi:hypothetical protein